MKQLKEEVKVRRIKDKSTGKNRRKVGDLSKNSVHASGVSGIMMHEVKCSSSIRC